MACRAAESASGKGRVMNGVDMMLKSMGIDPEKIKQSLMEAQQAIMSEVKEIHNKLDTINNRLIRIETKLDTMPQDEAYKLLAENEISVIDELRSSYGINSDGNGYNGKNDRNTVA